MKKLLGVIFSFVLLLLIGTPLVLAATNYGEGNYGGGVYNVGDTPEPVPTTVSTTSSGNDSSAGSPQCTDGVPTGTSPWLYEANGESSRSVTMRFTNWQSPTDHFVLEYGTEAGKYTFGVASFGNKDTNSYTVGSLSPNTTYYFRVRAGNGCAAGTWSNELSAKTLGFISTNNLDITESSLVPVAESPTASPNCQTYTVKSGDTLWKISASELGDGNKYKDIASENSGTYPSLKNSNNVKVGWELKINCGAVPGKPSESQTPQTGYDVNVKVVDTNKKPVVGAKVTLHSTPQTTNTNNDGVATFTNVEAGNHTVQIAYNNYTGEQSINLTGDVKEFNLNIQVKQQSVFLDPKVITALVIMGLVIIFLAFKLLRKNK